jgi:RNA polymerase sigma-70 factor (ECF subfamily)
MQQPLGSGFADGFATRQWGLPLAFRRSWSTTRMTPATWPSASQGHAELIRVIAQDRDRAALADLFAYFGPRVKAWLLRAGASPTAADERAQETMLAVWRKARLFDPARAGASTWIFTIGLAQRMIGW